jgi:sugar lactone lactonase YvrE
MRLLTARGFLLTASVLGCTTAAVWEVLCAEVRAQGPAQHSAPRPLAAPGDPARLREEIKTLESLLPRLADRGAALYLLAHHYAHLGEYEKAKALLNECASLDEGFDPAEAQAFAPMKRDPAFRELVEHVSRRYPPVHRARVAFIVPQNDLFPEGLTVDGARRGFYISSMHHNNIMRLTESGEVSDFVKQDAYDLMPVGGVHVDPKDHSVWCATDPGEKNRSEIVHFDAQGKLLERYAAPGAGSHDLNDLVLREGREIYTTDTYANQVFRFDRRSHIFTALDLTSGNQGRPVFYPNGITLSADGNVLYVADMLGVLRLDLRKTSVQEVTPKAHDTLAGIDGLYWYKGGLVGVQTGIGKSRVMHWKLTPDGRRVVTSETLEQGTELVRDPTTGAILDDEFYFMTNTGIDNLDDDGKIVDPAKLEPVQIAVVPLK